MTESTPEQPDASNWPGRHCGEPFSTPCALLDSQGRILAVNHSWSEAVGRHDLLTDVGTDFTEVLGQLSSSGRAFAGVRSVLDGAANEFTIDIACGGSTGSRWFRLMASNRRDSQGGGSVVVLDITDRRRVEALLQESEERYREIAHAMQNSALCTLDLKGTIVTWNADAERITGFHGNEIIGRHFGLLFCEEDRAASIPRQALEQSAAEGVFEHRGWRARSDHTRFPAHTVITDLRGSDSALQGFLLRTRDLTGHAAAHPALRTDHNRLLSIIDSAMDAIITVDDEQRVVMFNQAAVRVFGVPVAEAMGSPLERFIPERFRKSHADHVRAFGRTGATNRDMGRLGTLSGLRAGGEEFPIEASISHAVLDGRKFYTVILRDISEKRRLESQLLQSQKMEGIGRLAGGVAHDFNNLLMGIFNYLTLATRKLEPDHPARAPLEHVKEAAERAASLTRQLLIFARKQVVRPTVIAPGDVVSGLAPMLQRLIGEDVKLRTIVAGNAGKVLADSSQLEQIVMNLALNARDAMPSGGSLTIEISNIRLDEAYCRNRVGATPGPHVMLAVTDTGTGMTPDVLSRLFEPFFTTKPPGKGTGLGLATCHGIVEQSGGHIAVYSEPGRGTSIKVFLKRVLDASVEEAIVEEELETPRGGIETILLVEDNAMVRDLAVDALREAGYHVLLAEDGLEALRLAGAHPQPIDLLVTDVVMPEMSGVALAEKLLAERPGLRIIFMSGYTDETIAHHGVETGSSVFLSKPFMTDTLLVKVREVLDAH